MTASKREGTALSVKDVAMSYGRFEVIKGLDLDVKHGETFGLMGLNGVGKTTLIKGILGLRDIDCGEITIDDLKNTDPGRKKRIAFLPERFEPPWFLSGLEFLKFSLSLYGRSFDRDTVFDASDRLDLNHEVLHNRVQTYSKGMRQKLGLLSALLTECPLMILDEPMSGLDPRARTLVKDVLKEAREKGQTIFMSSHILSDMNEVCDRVAVLNGGQLIFTGTPEDLRKQGKNENIERAFLEVIDKAA